MSDASSALKILIEQTREMIERDTKIAIATNADIDKLFSDL